MAATYEHCPTCQHTLLWHDGQLVSPRRSCPIRDVDPAATGPTITTGETSRVHEEVREG
jgi:hypothetical protein